MNVICDLNISFGFDAVPEQQFTTSSCANIYTKHISHRDKAPFNLELTGVEGKIKNK